MGYKDEAPRQDGLERFSGVMITQVGCQHRTHVAAGQKGRSVFRIFPDMENGNILPQRLSADPFDFSSWIKQENAVRMAGVNDKFTCLTRVKGASRRDPSPIERFLQAMRKALTDTPTLFPEGWKHWIGKDKAELPRVDQAGFLQGALLENAGKVCAGPDGRAQAQKPVLFLLTKTAREGLENLCNSEVPGYKGNPEDYTARFACGDLVSPAGGRPIVLTFVPDSSTTKTHYDVTVDARPVPFKVETVKKFWKPWNEIFYFMTEQEQIALLCKYYPAIAVDWVFGATPQAKYFPEGVRGAFAASKHQAQAAPLGRTYTPATRPAVSAPPATPVYDTGEDADPEEGPSSVGQAVDPVLPVSVDEEPTPFDGGQLIADEGEEGVYQPEANADVSASVPEGGAEDFAGAEDEQSSAPPVLADPTATMAAAVKVRLLAAKNKMQAAKKV